MSGRVVGSGRFRVDRGRALEKMERFQLEDPHRYVLEWVAAAVVGGAERVDIYNDSDDFRISWEGEPPSGEELDTLFDPLWGTPEDGHEAMLQHLGLGVLGALGLGPKWIHLDCGSGGGDLRLTVRDPTETRHERLGTRELSGVRCHVREQLGSSTIREALTALFSPPTETHLVRGAARWAPVPVWINGRRIEPPAPPSGTLLDWSGEAGRLWIAVGGTPPVDLVRHGIVVGHHAIRIGSFEVGGWWRGDALRLNASRSAVVEDPHLAETMEEIERALDDGLRHRLVPEIEGAEAREIRWREEGDRARLQHRVLRGDLLYDLALAGIERLKARGAALGALEDAEILADTSGRRWSVAALRAMPERLGTTDRALDDPGFPYVTFAPPVSGTVLRLVGVLPDFTRELEERAEGRKRRAEGAKQPLEPVFAGEHRPLSDPPLRGAIRIGTLGGGGPGRIRIRVRVDRVPLCEVEIPWPVGQLDAILDNPRFSTDAAFREITKDRTWTHAVEVLRDEAVAAICDRVAQLAPRRPHEALLWLTGLLPPARGALDPRLAALEAVSTGRGRRISPERILALAEQRPWLLIEALPRGCPEAVADEVLLVPLKAQGRWLDWLGDRALTADALHARIERHRRLSGAVREPVLSGSFLARTSVSGGGLRGELGMPAPLPNVRRRAGIAFFFGGAKPELEPDPRITVLRAGIEVCTLGLRGLRPAGCVGVVDGADLEVSDAHDALTKDAVERLTEGLRSAADALALATWDALGPGVPLPELLAEWLADRLRVVEAGDRPVAWRADGRPVTLEALRDAPSGEPLRVVREPPGDLPGFGDVVLRTPSLEILLGAISRDRWLDADVELRGARQALERLLTRPPWRAPEALARVELSGEGWSGLALLPDSPEIGERSLTALWRDRAIAVWRSETRTGAALVVWGEAIATRASFAGAQDQTLAGIEARAAEMLGPLVEQAIAARDPAAAPEPWLRLIARLAGDDARDAQLFERLCALPLARTIQGEPVSLARIRRHAASSPLFLVSPKMPDGPTDDALYLRHTPGLDTALAAVFGYPIAIGDGALAAWREGKRRREAMQRLPPTVQAEHPVLVRAPLAAGGEVALLASGDGLLVQPLVDGLPLQPIQLPFPLPAAVVLEGPGVEADPAFLRHRDTPAWRARLDVARAALAGLVHARLAAPTDLAWAWEWILRDPTVGRGARPQVELDAAVFPLADGGRTSLRELDERQQRDGFVAVTRAREEIRRGPQPVCLSTDRLRELLERRYALRELPPREPLPEPDAGRPTFSIPPPRRGWLAAGRGPITVAVCGRPLRQIPCPGPLPLEGCIEDDALSVDPAWSSIDEDDAWRALLAWIEATSRAGLLARIRGGRDPDGLRRWMMTWPVRCFEPPDPEDELLAALRIAPLFEDSQGGRLSLVDLLALGEIRAVPPEAQGEPLPGRSPFVRLNDRERSWLCRALPLQDAAQALLRETRGAERRRRPPQPKPAPPPGALSLRDGETEAALWLSEAAAQGVRVFVGGRFVCDWADAVPDLCGWLDGPFETDDAFSEAALPEPVAAWAEDAIAALVAGDLASEAGVAAAWSRLERALRSQPLQVLVQRPCWRDLALLRDLSGRPVPLWELAASGRWHWDEPSEPFDGGPSALSLSREERERLRRLIPGLDLQRRTLGRNLRSAGQLRHEAWLRERAERERAERERQQQERDAQQARVREQLARRPAPRSREWERALSEQARRGALAEALCAILPPGIDPEPNRADHVRFWLPYVSNPDDARRTLLAAWGAASSQLHEAGRPEEELGVIAAVSERLAAQRAG